MSVNYGKEGISLIERALPEKDSIRIDLVCGISTHDMHDGLVAARMIFEPRIKFEDLAVKDNDCHAVGNHALDLSSGQEVLLARHWIGGAVRLRSRCDWRSTSRLMRIEY